MTWSDLRNRLVNEVKLNDDKPIEIKNSKVVKMNGVNDKNKVENQKRLEMIEIYKSQVYRRDDRFYDLHNDDIHLAYDYLKELMWRKGFNFRDDGMSYLQFYEYVKEISLEYKNYENDERSEMALVGLMDIDISDTDEYITPSDEYNLITKSF